MVVKDVPMTKFEKAFIKVCFTLGSILYLSIPFVFLMEINL